MFDVAQIEFDPEKNEWLKKERGISFEQVIPFLKKSHILDVIEHPNHAKYPNQKLCILDIDGYAYVVPFVEGKKKIFLKTIIPSRKATATYLKSERNKK